MCNIYKCKIDVFDKYGEDYIDGQYNVFKNKYDIKMAIEEYFNKYDEPCVDVIIINNNDKTHCIRKCNILFRNDISRMINKII